VWGVGEASIAPPRIAIANANAIHDEIGVQRGWPRSRKERRRAAPSKVEQEG